MPSSGGTGSSSTAAIAAPTPSIARAPISASISFCGSARRCRKTCSYVIAERDARPIACALFVRDAERLYGRYWGAVEHVPLLHFECCYYQAIEYAIARGLKVFEGGAQGEHKIFRGLLPVEGPSRTGSRTQGSRARWRISCSAKAPASRVTSTSYANIARSRSRKRRNKAMRLKDKLAIVTGAGSGFGAGIAKRFAAEGARVIVNDVNPSGEKVAKDIGGTFVQADVTKSADWAKLVRAAGEGLDIIVNNAGWTHRNKPYLEVTEAEFDRVYAVNVKSIYLSALHAVPLFRKRGARLLRQHRLHRRRAPTPRAHRLQQLQGRRDPDVEVDGGGIRPRPHPGELRQPGIQP